MGDTHDQTCIPPSFASLLQMMCIFVSVNLMMHFFCSFSIDCMISEWNMIRECIVYVGTFSYSTRKRRYVLDRRAKPHLALARFAELYASKIFCAGGTPIVLDPVPEPEAGTLRTVLGVRCELFELVAT